MVFISRTFKFLFLVCCFTIELIPVVKIQTLFTKWYRPLLLIYLKMTAHNTNVEPGQSIEVLWLNQLRRQGIYSLVGFYFLLHPCLTTFLSFKKNITTIKLLFSNEILSTPPIENGVLKRVSCQSWNSKVSGASKSSLRYNDSFFKITM